MGVEDEHWCSKCNKKLNKKSDRYVQMEYLNWKKVENKFRKASGKKPLRLTKKHKKEFAHTRVMVCEVCFNSIPGVADSLGKLRFHGNPNFNASIYCHSYGKCKNFEFRNSKVNCKHIAVIEDKIYCKRKHPGFRKLMQESTVVNEHNTKNLQKMFEKMLKRTKIPKGMLTDALTGFFKGDVMANLKYFPDHEIVQGSKPYIPDNTPKTVVPPKVAEPTYPFGRPREDGHCCGNCGKLGKKCAFDKYPEGRVHGMNDWCGGWTRRRTKQR